MSKKANPHAPVEQVNRPVTDPVFTADWFSNNIPNWTVWLGHLFGARDVAGLEIGSYEGRSSRWLLDHIFGGKGCALVCIDIEFAANFKANVVEPFSLNASDWEMSSAQYFRYEAPLSQSLSSLSLVYIDGSHRAADVLEDSVLAWPYVVVGGIVIWDDYQWLPEDPAQARDSPKAAIDAFLAAHAGEWELLEDVPGAVNPGWQKAVRKIR